MSEAEQPTEENSQSQAGRGGHARRPPLAEIDTWELWQAWRRGEWDKARPWIGLLLGFCVVLAAMYAFFYYTTSINRDTVAQIVLLIVLVGFLFAVWRRINERRVFAFYVTLGILLISGTAFAIWYVLFVVSGYSSWFATLGTPAMGMVGMLIGLRSLNAIAASQTTDDGR